MGAAWGVVAVAMLAVLLVVFVRRIRLLGEGSGRMIATGLIIGLAVVGIALLGLATG